MGVFYIHFLGVTLSLSYKQLLSRSYGVNIKINIEHLINSIGQTVTKRAILKMALHCKYRRWHLSYI